MNRRAKSGVTARLIPVDSYPDLAADWSALEARADGSPFSAWPWVSTWLDHLPKVVRPSVFRAEEEDGVIALGLLVDSRERGVRRLLGERVLHLQETGDREMDRLTIDYGGLLARRGSEERAYAALFETLEALHGRTRNLRISASIDAPHVVAALPSSMSAFRAHCSPSYAVDLGAIAAAGGDYLASLGSSTRSGLRRTRRAYESVGAIRIETAQDAEQALGYFEELSVLHEKHWQSKGRQGSFGSPFFVAFHRDLIRKHVASGLTQLSRVTAGTLLVGYLYNLVWREGVYVYNSGLNYGALEQRHDRPGYLAHLVAIEKYLAEGMKSYDFLAGEAIYKRVLSSRVRTVDWIVVKPHGWRLSLDRVLTRCRLREPTPQLPAPWSGEPEVRAQDRSA
jgi:CelD/BcsL family acetyltransferase involved in cellulose biosynthesis